MAAETTAPSEQRGAAALHYGLRVPVRPTAVPHSVPCCAAAVHAGTGSTPHRPAPAPRLRWRPRPPVKGCAANRGPRLRSHSARAEPRSQGLPPPRRPGPGAPVTGLVTAGVGRGAPPGNAHLLGRGEPRSAARPQHGSERRPARPAGRRLARVLPAPPPPPLTAHRACADAPAPPGGGRA